MVDLRDFLAAAAAAAIGSAEAVPQLRPGHVRSRSRPVACAAPICI
jgi:hypothetical protein